MTVLCYTVAMSNQLEQTLRHYPHAVLTANELACLLGGSPDSRYGRVKRALKKGDLTRVRRGVYTINPLISGHLPHHFEVAQKLYAPSFISLHSALAFYHLIPEAVYLTTSATIASSTTIETPHGNFNYQTLPAHNFYTDVQLITTSHASFLIANPWRALLDLMAIYKKSYLSIEEPEEDLRLDIDELPTIEQTVLAQLDTYYRNPIISNFIQTIPKDWIT